MAEDKMEKLNKLEKVGKYVLNNPCRHPLAALGALEWGVMEWVSQIFQGQMDLSDIGLTTLSGAIVGYTVGAVLDTGKYVSEKIWERRIGDYNLLGN